MAKCAVFGRDNSGTAPKQTSISPSFTHYRNGQEQFIRNLKNCWKKIDALGFYCPRWSEMCPKSLWNNKFDQILVDIARQSFAGNIFGRKIAAR